MEGFNREYKVDIPSWTTLWSLPTPLRHFNSNFSPPKLSDVDASGANSLSKSLPAVTSNTDHGSRSELGVARTGTLHDSQHSILNDTQVKQLSRSLPGYYRVDAVPSVSDSPSRELHASIATAGSETAADELSSIEVSGASESTELCEPPHRNKELDDSDQWVMIGVSEASEATGTVEQKPKSKWKMVRRGR